MDNLVDPAARKIYLAGQVLDAIVSFDDVEEPIVVENTFLNHLGADLELTGMKPRSFTMKGMILTANPQDMATLDSALVLQRENPIDLSVPGFGVFNGFVEKKSINKNGAKEGYDFDLTFKEHTAVERPQVTSANVAQATATNSSASVQKTHHVVKGDTYERLADRYYGDFRLWRKIADLNPYPSRRIPIGVVLRIS